MKKKAFLLFALRVLKLGFGILNLSVSAKYFGVSINRDQWLLALNFILVVDMALWGPINETFRAKFIFLRNELGEEQGLIKVKSMFSFINIVTLLLVIFILIFPRIATSIIAPNYTGAELESLTFMIMIVTPALLFNQISQFLISILNSYNTFYLPEISGFFTAIFNIIFVVVFAPHYGIYALSLGYYFGILLLLFILLWQVKKQKINVIGNPFKFKARDIIPFIAFAAPFFVPYSLGQINLLVEKSLASTMQIGAVSQIDYARKFSEIATTVLGSIFTTMLLPVLSQHFAESNKVEFLNQFKSIFQLSFLILTLLIGVFTACPMSVINLLYNKGTITAQGLEQIGNLSTIYGWSALSITLYLMWGIALLASDMGKVYAYYGAIAQVAMIVINVACYRWFKIYTFPIALLFSHLLVAVFLFTKLPMVKRGLLVITAKGLLQIIICSSIAYGVNYLLINKSVINPIIIISITTGLIITLIAMFAFIAKTDDRFIIVKMISKFRSAGK